MAETIRELIFDTETTGLNAREGDRVIEIGAVELVNRFPTGNTFHMFINPQGREVHPEALEIHGISNEFLADKPTFEEIFEQFEEFFGHGMLVAHNASFDLGFINAELVRIGQPELDSQRIVDTLVLARRKFPGQRNSLDALCARFGIDNSHREKHGALLDSEILAEVYLELLGGRQATLILEHPGASSDDGDLDADQLEKSASLKRPGALPCRLSAEEIARHQEFVETLGENPIWKKIGLI